MPPRPGTRAARGRRSNLQTLLSISRAILYQLDRGIEPEVSSLDAAAAERACRDLAEELKALPLADNLHEFIALWTYPSQDTAAYLAFLSLSLRRSSLFPAGDGPAATYARTRDLLFLQLGRAAQDVGLEVWGPVCRELLGPALLRTDALQCLSRLLAEAAEQLKPAAALVFPRPPQAEADGSEGSRNQQQQLGPGMPREVHTAPRTQPPSLAVLEQPLRTLITLLSIFCAGIQHLSSTKTAAAAITTRTTAAPAGPSCHVLHATPALLHSSGVLEHWAQVVLLGPLVAAARGAGRNPNSRTLAVALQADLLCPMCQLLIATRIGVADFVRGPCGSGLASTYMAYLCAALDGGDAFGLDKVTTIVMLAGTATESVFLQRRDRWAEGQDAGAAGERWLASLQAVVGILLGWYDVLVEDSRGLLRAGRLGRCSSRSRSMLHRLRTAAGLQRVWSRPVAEPRAAAASGALGKGGRGSERRWRATEGCCPLTGPPPSTCACAWPRGCWHAGDSPLQGCGWTYRLGAQQLLCRCCPCAPARLRCSAAWRAPGWRCCRLCGAGAG